MPVIKIIDKLAPTTGHTPEPWIYALPDAHHEGIICGQHGGTVVDGEFNEANARRIVACINACAGLTTEQLEIILDDNHTVTSLLTRSQNKLESLQHTLAAIAKEIELAGFQVGGPAADPETDLNPRTARALITRATERFAAIGALLAPHKD